MNYKKFIGILVITLLIGFIPNLFVSINLDNLIKPVLMPPKVLFPIVWTVLYILMSISLYLASEKGNDTYIIYFIQLIINSLWTLIFFKFNLRLIGFFWIILLLVLVGIMIIKFYKRNKLSAYLQIPYVLWLLFASYLDLALYILNK